MNIKLKTMSVIDYYDCEKIVGINDIGDFYFTNLIENDTYYYFDCSDDRITVLESNLEEFSHTELEIRQMNNDLKLIHYIRSNFNLEEILVHIYW